MIRFLFSSGIILLALTVAVRLNKMEEATDSSQTQNGLRVKITRFVDGDTFWASHENNEPKKYRLIGIDAPERSNSFKHKKHSYGEISKQALIDLLPDSTAFLRFDRDSFDRYKRYLVYVFTPDTKFVNQILVRNGHAWAKNYPPNDFYQMVLMSSQDSAAQEQLGIWLNFNANK